MTMIKTILLTGLVSTLVASSSAFAAGTNGSSRFAPGQEVKHHARGSVGGPGASGYAPGRIYNDTGKKSVKGHPGASGYAPGQR
jgi:hypothetical protein